MASSSTTCECNIIKEENESLKKKFMDLNNIVTKFTLGEKNLNILLESQRCLFNKEGLGYRPYKKSTYLKNHFVKAST